MQQLVLFEQIFSDAHLVDIDLSAWDKYITLYVLADHAGRTEDNHLPLFMVEFVRVRSWDIMFNHLTHQPPIELDRHEHVQWRIDDFRVDSVAEGLQIMFLGLPSSPRMTILCEDVRIRELPLDVPNRLYPGWARPSSGFIRPGLADLLPDHRTNR